MKRKIVWLLVSCLMGIVLALTSCNGSTTNNITSNTSQINGATSTTSSNTSITATNTGKKTTTTVTTTSQTQSADTLSTILGRAQNILTMKYTMVVTMPGVPATSTVTWVKKNKMRMEMSAGGIATVNIIDIDAGVMYTYMPAQNIAMKMSIPQTSESAKQEAGSIAGYNPENLGTESVDGTVCYVFRYSVSGNTEKMWISKDHGLPVKMEITSSQGTIITEFKNYDFSDIPDSMFELPAGVQMMQTGQ